MDFQEALIFISAIIIVVSAGVVLGALLRGRTSNSAKPIFTHDKANMYARVTEVIDKIPKTGAEQRHRLADLYYDSLIYAPDYVIKAFNHYIRVAAKAIDPYSEEMLNAKDGLIIVMRQDIQESLGSKSKLTIHDILSIEIKDNPSAQTKK
jgi:hypothetical protein